jgi:hypothetical protein
MGYFSECNDEATGLMTGIRFSEGAENFFSSSPLPDRRWGLLSLLTNGYRPGVLSLGVKRLGREADRLPPSSVHVKKAWSCTSTSHTFNDLILS